MTAGTVRDLDTLEAFLRGRLRTAGLVAAGIAAAACAHARGEGQMVKYPEFRDAVFASEIPGASGGPTAPQGNGGLGEPAELARDSFWASLDAEVDARTPSPAQREASRRQGRALLRAARVAWPDAAWLTDLKRPHHAVVLGAAAAAAGCAPAEAARIAAYQAVAGPVSAAVRLLALDPMRATGVLARLAGEIDQVAELAAGYARGPLDDLPCASAPALDLLAEVHIRAEVRLFES